MTPSPKMIFVNLPVADLTRSVAFYEAIGARKDDRFSDMTAACMVLSETIFVMLLTHEKFAGFTPKPIADAHKATEVLLCVSEASREAVDATVERARSAGGRIDPGPQQDYGFKYGRSFDDPDGHVWEVMWMDVEAAMQAHGAAPEPAAA